VFGSLSRQRLLEMERSITRAYLHVEIGWFYEQSVNRIQSKSRWDTQAQGYRVVWCGSANP
jgi:hypothetical protein